MQHSGVASAASCHRVRFITFEGGEGSGKSTQAKLLVDALRGSGIDGVLTREPGGSPFAEQVRDLILDPAHRAAFAAFGSACCSMRRAPTICRSRSARPWGAGGG